MATTAHTKHSNAVPVHHHHVSGVAHSFTNAAACGKPPAREVRRLVASAVKQRRFLITTGRGHVDARLAAVKCDMLQQWLARTNDFTSQQTLLTFWQQHELDLRIIVAGPSGGHAALLDIERFCKQRG